MPKQIQFGKGGAVTPHSQQDIYAPPASGTQVVDLRWFWLALLRHKLLMVLAVCCTLVPTLIYVRFAEPVYRATAVIQIDPGSAKVLPYTDVSDWLSNPLPHFELYMKTQDEVLRSRGLRLRVAARLGEESGADSWVLPDDLGEGLQVQRVEGSQMLRISYLAPDPNLAAAIANAWADEFVKLHVEKRYQTGERATDFLQSQLANLKLKVEKAEADLIEYARVHNILSIDSKQENTIRQRFGYLNAETARAEKDLIARQAEYESLKKVSVENFPESLKGPVVSSLETKAFQLEQELVRLRAQFDEKWPAVSQKRDELEAVHRQLAGVRGETLARALKQSETQYSAALAEHEMLRRSFQQQQSLVNRLNQASIEYNALKRELDASEQLYQGLLQRLKEAGVSAGLEVSNINIADRATPPDEPYRPRKSLSLGLAALLGMMLWAGLSVVLEYANNTLRDPWEVEPLGVALLGWVPKLLDGRNPRRAIESAYRGSSLVSLSLLPAAKRPEDHAFRDAHSREAYRTLCASILLSRGDSPPRTILIASAVPREGKTTVTMELGQALAEMCPPVLLIDADLRCSNLTRGFLGGCSEGLSTYLAGGPLVVKESGTPNLSVLAAGPTPPNPVALINAGRMTELLTELGNRFRFILIDSPPLLGVADSSLLAPKVEGVVLVVRALSTPTEIVRKATRQLERTGCTVLGAIVNALDLREPGYSYYQKYYYRSESEASAKSS